ncbi:hypothetical protein P280DRAFT_517286 [Massarina eburnea CBS 473.64]|uniref:Uncharacterized protein n=1 Tax=Massarina eburnea CBS 473.64 TaxID=1395130 RepID=A0A6A6RZR0_9PLEO|nr:hypothetical protein P280DRAFT_517286 [Massarina eburnea CBS 473.64]
MFDARDCRYPSGAAKKWCSRRSDRLLELQQCATAGHGAGLKPEAGGGERERERPHWNTRKAAADDVEGAEVPGRVAMLLLRETLGEWWRYARFGVAGAFTPRLPSALSTPSVNAIDAIDAIDAIRGEAPRHRHSLPSTYVVRVVMELLSARHWPAAHSRAPSSSSGSAHANKVPVHSQCPPLFPPPPSQTAAASPDAGACHQSFRAHSQQSDSDLPPQGPQHQHSSAAGPSTLKDRLAITRPIDTTITVSLRARSIIKETPAYTMPSITRPTIRPALSRSSSHSSSSSSKKDRSVGFLKDPVSHVSRPVNMKESWAAYDFELHAHKCAYCRDPYEVHRAHEQLCEVGHRLAQEVAEFLYNRPDGETYSTTEEDNKLVRVEVPSGYSQVKGLLKAIERSLRHRSRTPFVSMDRTYYVAARVPTRAKSVKADTKSVKVDQAPKVKSIKPSRPRSGEIVEWPGMETRVEVAAPHKKRGSLYEQDVAAQRRHEKQYHVEVREPSRRDLREQRLSGYYR